MTLTDLPRIFDHAPIGIFIVDSNWILTYANAKARMSFEMISELIGQDFAELTKVVWTDETAQSIHERFRHTLETAESYSSLEHSDEGIDPHRREYHDWQIQQIDLSEKERGVVCYFHDVTKHVQARKAVEDSKRQLHDLAEAMPQMVWTANPDGGLEFTNRTMLDYLGAVNESVRGWNFVDFIHPDDAEKVKTVWSQALSTGETYEIDFRIRDKLGNFAWFLVRGLPVRTDDGEIVKWFGTCTDIQSQREAAEDLERRVLERTDQLRAALDEAEKANSLKAQFVSTISHEVRTPLASIIGLAEYMTTIELKPDVSEVADHIYKSSKRLLTILNGMLDFSKLEAGKVGLDFLAFDPRVLFAETQALFQRECLRKKVTLTTELDAALPKQLCGDEQKTRQILTNLLSNATKFTDKGSIVIKASVVPGTVSAKSLRVSVTDSGIGISPEAQEKIFQPFTQADSSMTRRFGGTGLGLSICKRYVELLGGEIGCESSPSQGSTFWFIIPFLEEGAEVCQLSQ